MEDLRSLLYRLKEQHTLTKEEWTALIAGRTPSLPGSFSPWPGRSSSAGTAMTFISGGLLNYQLLPERLPLLRHPQKQQKRGALPALPGRDPFLLPRRIRSWLSHLRPAGREDGYFTDERMIDLIQAIKSRYPDCAVTLSIGERSRESYQAFFDAGADRYLLRHETFNGKHYSRLHPLPCPPPAGSNASGI